MIIRDAHKFEQKALICFWGVEKQGKTHAALELATALSSDGRIGVISSEKGSSALLSWKFPHQFINLNVDDSNRPVEKPFTVQRYTEALDAFLSAKYPVIIIDSLTHLWEGEGGILDVVSSKGGEFQKGWDVGTPLYQKFVNKLIAASAHTHIIITLRAKEAYEMETYIKGNGAEGKRPKNIGLAPVIRKGFGFEMQLMIRVEEQVGYVSTSATQEYFPHGKELRSMRDDLAPDLLKWLQGAPPPEVIPTFNESCKRGLETGAWTQRDMLPALSALLGISITRDTFFTDEQLKQVAEAAEKGPVTVG